MRKILSAEPDWLMAFAALNGALAVILGAFAAHGAEPAARTLLTTGGHYQLIHATLALAISLWGPVARRIRWAGWLAATGGMVFSLALASLALAGIRAAGAIAPIGGILMIAGWLLLLVAAFRSSRP